MVHGVPDVMSGGHLKYIPNTFQGYLSVAKEMAKRLLI